MIFKKFSISILFLFVAISAYAQQWEVIKFEENKLDFSAIKFDVNVAGTPCALIKLSIPSDNVKFKSAAMSPEVKPELKDGYWWIYLLEDARNLRVIVNNNSVIEIDFIDDYQIHIKGKATYILEIKEQEIIKEVVKYIRKPFISGIEDISVIFGYDSGSVCGDYFGMYTEVKLGNPNGIGLEFGYGPGLDPDHLYNDNWTMGLKGYIGGWYMSVHYGTTLPIYGKRLSGEIKPDGTIIQDGTRNYGRYGFDFLVGYDKSFKWLHFEIGAGVIVPTENTKILPAWTIGVGLDLFKLYS